MKGKEKQLTVVIEKVLRETKNCDMSIETLTDYLVDRIKDKVIPEDSVVLTREEYLQDFNKQFNKGYEKGSKETAREILAELQGYYHQPSDTIIIDTDDFYKLAKQYGVE